MGGPEDPECHPQQQMRNPSYPSSPAPSLSWPTPTKSAQQHSVDRRAVSLERGIPRQPGFIRVPSSTNEVSLILDPRRTRLGVEEDKIGLAIVASLGFWGYKDALEGGGDGGTRVGIDAEESHGGRSRRRDSCVSTLAISRELARRRGPTD
jgi:hypothetical protein